MRWVVLLGALAGCQDLFKLEHVDRPADARGDAVSDTADGAADAAPICWNTALTGDDDGDGHIDGCDPCPGNPDTNPLDTDHDGIPDVCDPEAGPNTLLDFLPLSSPAGWSQYSGSWGVAGSDFVQTDSGSVDALDVWTTALTQGQWIQVHVQGPDAPTSGNTDAGVFLSTQGTNGLFDGLSCAIERTSATTQVLIAHSFSNGSVQGTSSIPAPAAPDAWLTARVSTGECIATFADGTRRSVATLGSNRGYLPQLLTVSSTATFMSVTLYGP